MDQRIKIPGLALLGLSLTECVERDSGDQPDPILGDWHAVLVDGEKFPMVEDYEGSMQQTDIELHVQADLDGTLAFVYRVTYDGYFYGYENGSTLVVDASEAPKYRLEVAHPPFGGGPDEPYDASSISITGYDSYNGTSYEPTEGDPTADPTGYDPTSPIDPGPARPLQIPPMPKLAPAEMILTCTLELNTLTCKREDPEPPTDWVFERDPPFDPAT